MKEILILGVGCATCEKLYTMVKEIVTDSSIKVEKVNDINEIMKYNIMSTPALVIDGKVVHAGALPKIDKLKEFINGGSSKEDCPCSCGGKC